MKKILIRMIFYFLSIISLGVHASSDQRIVKIESKNLPSMKSCISWLDKKIPNKEWHSNGTPWEMLIDTPDLIIGGTTIVLGGKRHPTAFSCELFETGTKGNYFEGEYRILRPK